MGTEKRARQKAGRQARIEAAEAAQRRAATRSRVIRVVMFAVVGAAILGAGAFFSRNNSSSTVDTGAAGTTTTVDPKARIIERNGQTVPPDPNAPSTTVQPPAPTGPTTAPPVTVAGKTITGDTPCPPADGTAERTVKFEKAPPMCLDPKKTYTAKMSTTKGDLTIQLDPKSAPKAANNFVVLARYHFFDGVAFHRVIPGFVVQGGDATGTPPGTGDAGYKFEDELPADASLYKKGTLAMANSGANTNGSQFFIMLDQGKLGPQYSIFGQVTEGFDTTVKAIEAGGSPSGTPTDPAAIKTVTITES